jgi:GNAT superfamily N-acetyltransferase
MEITHEHFIISDDKTRLQLDVIYTFLSEESYWARGVPRSVIERAVEHSMCFGLYDVSQQNVSEQKEGNERQVGFARLVTDRATFAYLADVFVLPELRGQGLSKMLMHFILEHPDVQGLRRWMLGTRDAHGLYAQFGFAPLDRPEIFMQIHNPNVYNV